MDKKTRSFWFALLTASISVLTNIFFIWLQINNYFGTTSTARSASVISIIIYISLVGFIVFALKELMKKPDKEILEEIIKKLKFTNKQDRCYNAHMLLQSKFDRKINEYSSFENHEKYSINLGFLGTLVGLVAALPAMDDALNSSGANTNNMLSGLFVAFLTSIAGIITAIALNISYRRLNKITANKFLEAEEKLPEEIFKSFPDDDTLKEWYILYRQKFGIKEGQNKATSFDKDLETLSIPIKNAVEQLTKSIITSIDEKFKLSIAAFTKAINEFPTSFEKEVNTNLGVLVKQSTASIETIKNTHKDNMLEMKTNVKDSISKLFEDIKKNSNDLQTDLINAANIRIQGNDEKIQRVIEKIINITSSIEKIESEINKSNKKVCDLNVTMTQANIKFDEMGKNVGNYDKNLSSHNEILNKNIKGLGETEKVFKELQVSVDNLAKLVNMEE